MVNSFPMRRAPHDPALKLRGRLIRGLGAFRDMLPGSFVEVQRSCGKANCRCADGIHLHRGFQLSVLVDGVHRTFYVPTQWAAEIQANVEHSKRFQDAVARIYAINLRRFLRRKNERKRQPPRATPPV